MYSHVESVSRSSLAAALLNTIHLPVDKDIRIAVPTSKETKCTYGSLQARQMVGNMHQS